MVLNNLSLTSAKHIFHSVKKSALQQLLFKLYIYTYLFIMWKFGTLFVKY
jgi:hypothetical protein